MLCHYAKCRALFISMLHAITPSVIILFVTFLMHYAECRFAECHYAKCCYVECHYDECYYADLHYAVENIYRM